MKKRFNLNMLADDFKLVKKAAIKDKRNVTSFIIKTIVDRAKEVLLE